jgi:hypothetical protein
MDPVTLQTIEVGDAHVRHADGILRKLRHLLSLPEDEARAYAKKVARRLGNGATLDAEACTLTVPVALLFTSASTGGAAQVLRVSFRSGAATAADQHGGSRRRSRSVFSSSRSGDTDARGPSASGDDGDEAAATPAKKGRLATLPERARNAFLGKPVVDAFVYALGEHMGEANAALVRVAEAERVVTAAHRLPDVAQHSSEAVGEEAMRSNAIRDVHLADVQRMERLRTSKLWQDVQECAREFESALLHTGFTRDQLPRWRSCLTAAFAELRKIDADTDGMACAGMPSLPADLEAVRSKRKAFCALIDQDLARVTQLMKACDDLAALIRTTGWLHHETPLEAAPSV